jgi:hypothetical protein
LPGCNTGAVTPLLTAHWFICNKQGDLVKELSAANELFANFLMRRGGLRYGKKRLRLFDFFDWIQEISAGNNTFHCRKENAKGTFHVFEGKRIL